jgi:hypothetical protein
MLKNLYCKTCAHAEYICKPQNICCICKKHGIGIPSSAFEVLKIVGCNSYKYDENGLTDLERSFNKKGNV